MNHWGKGEGDGGRRIRLMLTPYLWAFLGVLAATAVYWPMEPIMAKGHDPSLLFLPVVIACAVRLGFGPAILASILGFISWDYMFIPPRFTLIVTTPQDYLALGVYLLAGITTAQLAAQARRKTEESEERGREIAMLYHIGQIVSGEADPERMTDTLVKQIAQVCATERCVIFRIDNEGRCQIAAVADERADHSADAPTDDQLLAAAWNAISQPALDEEGSLDATRTIFPLRLRETPVGALYVDAPANGRPRNPREIATIRALSNYTAAVIGRQNFAEDAQRRVQTAAVTEERNRLTREIHDTVAQSLTGIVILLQAADGAGPQEQADVIAQAGHLAQDCLAEARRSVRAMRPGALEGQDLPAALRALADRTRRSGVSHTIFQTTGLRRPLAAEAEANLFRIGQEALTNALRHARADNIVIRLGYSDDGVELSIQDDGCGIDAARQNENGFGMTSMRERALQIGATLTIDRPQNGVGTLITVVAPQAVAAEIAPDSSAGKAEAD